MYVDLSLKENEVTLKKLLGHCVCMLGPTFVNVYVCYSRLTILTTYMYVDPQRLTTYMYVDLFSCWWSFYTIKNDQI